MKARLKFMKVLTGKSMSLGYCFFFFFLISFFFFFLEFISHNVKRFILREMQTNGTAKERL